jgi:hypothetical protein
MAERDEPIEAFASYSTRMSRHCAKTCARSNDRCIVKRIEMCRENDCIVAMTLMSEINRTFARRSSTAPSGFHTQGQLPK